MVAELLNNANVGLIRNCMHSKLKSAFTRGAIFASALAGNTIRRRGSGVRSERRQAPRSPFKIREIGVLPLDETSNAKPRGRESPYFQAAWTIWLEAGSQSKSAQCFILILGQIMRNHKMPWTLHSISPLAHVDIVFRACV